MVLAAEIDTLGEKVVKRFRENPCLGTPRTPAKNQLNSEGTDIDSFRRRLNTATYNRGTQSRVEVSETVKCSQHVRIRLSFGLAVIIRSLHDASARMKPKQ